MNYERKMLKLFLLESGIIKTPQIRQKMMGGKLLVAAYLQYL